jgi:hypothetical protein
MSTDQLQADDCKQQTCYMQGCACRLIGWLTACASGAHSPATLPRLLQLLDRDLEVAEEQHQTALGAHLMVLDSLLDLQVRAAGLHSGQHGFAASQQASNNVVCRSATNIKP